jgi:hypothetical protein
MYRFKRYASFMGRYCSVVCFHLLYKMSHPITYDVPELEEPEGSFTQLTWAMSTPQVKQFSS